MGKNPSFARQCSFLIFNFRKGRVWYALITFLYVDILGSFQYLVTAFSCLSTFIDTTGLVTSHEYKELG